MTETREFEPTEVDILRLLTVHKMYSNGKGLWSCEAAEKIYRTPELRVKFAQVVYQVSHDGAPLPDPTGDSIFSDPKAFQAFLAAGKTESPQPMIAGSLM